MFLLVTMVFNATHSFTLSDANLASYSSIILLVF